MRRRVVIVYVTLLVAGCLGLALPLCVSLAERGTSAMLLDRINDTTRFARIAESAVVTGEAGSLNGELVAYDRLYGITAVVVDREGAVVVSSREGVGPTELGLGAEEVPAVVRTALAGSRAGADTVIWPWDGGALVVAEPVGGAGEVVGAVVTASPTGALRRSILLQWGVACAVVAAVMVVGIAAAGPLTGWVLRPIVDLEEATRAVSGGSLDARVRTVAGPFELRRLGESFNHMADTIASMLENQRMFVAYAGHQVRNPLAALRLRVDALSPHLTAQGRQGHRLALDEVDRLARVCDSLLTLARAEDAEHSTVREDVSAVAEERVAAWSPIAERIGAELVAEVVPGVRVRCVEGTLDQALDALIDNALKFGGAGARIVVGVAAPVRSAEGGGHVDVHVLDDGPGLPEEQMAAAVRPFWRDGHRGGGGSGLGLSVVVTLLELQGARLTLRPRSPHGVEARLRLPLRAFPDPLAGSVVRPSAARRRS
ncbi:ATP-binding protein [Nocardiopsis sp. LOL_012]|uniref:sensor histidine kinase n=1 Tax=Nocardiopsis sp. LOL_012 TaxID=3345409 RepID=UPI003A8BDF9F